ncbi:MAG: SGNH/GDSL hydrolase family protein [Deltaproteobacteria bacterium]|nr:SGNH/GDSL hydrolase family protein [Deltaproteobacteria bacterium]
MNTAPFKPRPKICLLGGSNSLRRNGLRNGLAIHADVFNYALGASTSLQNVFAIVRNSHQISGVNVIVTESNVNDVHAAFNARIPVSLVKTNIQKLYRELALTGKPTVSLILPLRDYGVFSPSKELVSEISGHHLEMAQKYGLSIIDVEDALREYDSNHLDVKKIIPDALHPIGSFMHALGQNIALYAIETYCTVSPAMRVSNFEIVEATAFGGPGRHKKNSYFSEAVVDLTQPCETTVADGNCVAFSTWSDAPSEIIIETDNARVVRQFNSKLAFHDLHVPIQGEIRFRSNIGVSVGISEKTINVKPEAKLHQPVGIVALLIEKAQRTEPSVIGAGKNLVHLIPSPSVHIDAVESVLRNYRALLSTLTPEEIDLLNRVAVTLEHTNPALASKLLQLAQKHRPNGQLIISGIDSDKRRIKKKKQSPLRMLRRIMSALKKRNA